MNENAIYVSYINIIKLQNYNEHIIIFPEIVKYYYVLYNSIKDQSDTFMITKKNNSEYFFHFFYVDVG